MYLPNKEQEKVFLHAMHLMGDKSNRSGEIYKILKQNGINNVTGIFTLTKNEIIELTYSGKEESFQLNLGQCIKIETFIAFNINQIRAGQPLKEHEWINVTCEQFGEFQLFEHLYNSIFPFDINLKTKVYRF